MKLRNEEIESKYVDFNLKSIIDKQIIDKRWKYQVEWMNGRKEWVTENSIMHEQEKLKKFESDWWRKKKLREKEEKMKKLESSASDINESEQSKKLEDKETKEIKDLIEAKEPVTKSKKQIKGKKIILNDNSLYKDNFDVIKEETTPLFPTKTEPPIQETKQIDTKNPNQEKDNDCKAKVIKGNLTKPEEHSRILEKQRIEIDFEEKDIPKKTVQSNPNNPVNPLVPETPEVLFIGMKKNRNPETKIKILSYREKNDVEYGVKWKVRDDGTIPSTSILPECYLKEKYPQLLIDFLSKALRQKEIQTLEFDS